jgi:ligand-binding SRPBCC domain-containing protein
MAVITLETEIDAPRERVFDLARSIDAHQDTAAATGEKAVGGVTSGLLGPDQEVTWRARHFGIVQRLTVKMTRLERPAYFQDVMVRGAFRSMVHDHRFEERNGRTVMRDRFEFTAPLGVLGRLAEWLFLTFYMKRFLTERNAVLKRTAESKEWIKYLA